jgi:hypothetical protein
MTSRAKRSGWFAGSITRTRLPVLVFRLLGTVRALALKRWSKSPCSSTYFRFSFGSAGVPSSPRFTRSPCGGGNDFTSRVHSGEKKPLLIIARLHGTSSAILFIVVCSCTAALFRLRSLGGIAMGYSPPSAGSRQALNSKGHRRADAPKTRFPEGTPAPIILSPYAISIGPPRPAPSSACRRRHEAPPCCRGRLAAASSAQLLCGPGTPHPLSPPARADIAQEQSGIPFAHLRSRY